MTTAIAIFSFAMLAMLGVLPTAMKSHQDAKHATVIAQIQTRLLNELVMADFGTMAELNAYDGAEYYFDEYGLETEQTDPGRIYIARTDVEPAFVNGDQIDQAVAVRARVRVKHHPGTDGSIDANDNGSDIHESAVILAR